MDIKDGIALAIGIAIGGVVGMLLMQLQYFLVRLWYKWKHRPRKTSTGWTKREEPKVEISENGDLRHANSRMKRGKVYRRKL